jgi:FkbM family methyltransferase
MTILIAIAFSLLLIFATAKITLHVSKIGAIQPNSAPVPETSWPLSVVAPYQLTKARHGWILSNPNDHFLGRAILEYGEYGEIENDFLLQLLSARPGKIIELGANSGTHTVSLAKAAASRQQELIAFEPQPFIFQNLCANLALNGITNATAWPWACGAEPGTIYFPTQNYSERGNFGGVSMKEQAMDGHTAVPCVRLDDVIGNSPVSMIKIDVEGYELQALQGAVNILTNSRPLLYVENDRVEKSQALIEWIWAQNYQVFWHIPRLFNPNNFFNNATNIYDNIGSFNMLCVPRELSIAVSGLQEISDSTHHPLAK